MVTIKTEKLQDMVAISAKGASCDKILPITSLVAVEVANGLLTLTTTDSANLLKIRTDRYEGDDMYAVVPIVLFSKLVAKITTESVVLTLKEGVLEVRGNGVYNLPVSVDEDGLVKFPEKAYINFEKPETSEILYLTAVKSIVDTNKSAVAKSVDRPELQAYYLGDAAISTDNAVIACNRITTLSAPALVSPSMMELLALNTQEKITVYRNNSSLLFETDNMILFGPEHEGIDKYPYEAVTGFLSSELPTTCTLPKLLLKNVINRLSLFVEPYDKNTIRLIFSDSSLCISSKQSSGIEEVPYKEKIKAKEFVCEIDFLLLKEQVDAVPGDTVDISFGNDKAIKIANGSVVTIVGLLEDKKAEGKKRHE